MGVDSATVSCSRGVAFVHLLVENLPNFSFHLIQHGLQAFSIPSETGMMKLLTFLNLALEASNARLLLQDCLQKSAQPQELCHDAL